MKTILLSTFSIVLLSNCAKAQGGWSKITNTTIPIFSAQVSGQYNGAAWVDVNNDGHIDLFASPNKLYKNDGAGNFIVLDSLNFLPGTTAFNSIVGGASWADLNNDGFIDCVIAQHPSGVFINAGNNTFSNSGSNYTTLTNYAAWACAIGSLDNDAHLDIVYAHAAGFHAGTAVPSKLYVNKSNGVPALKTGIALTDSTKPYTVPYWSDFDLDGDLDLFVASGPGGTAGYDYCYKNLKIETGLDSLSRITNLLFTTQKQDGQCYNFIDYDNDGDLDLCLTNYAGAASRLYKNTTGVYAQVTAPWTSAALPYLANCWGDYDNDGDLDMISTSDTFSARYFRNNGNGTFTLLTNGINTPAGTSGACNGDYDNDGDLDIYLHGRSNAKALFRNDTVAATRKWVNFRLNGTLSNASGIGAIVRIKALINGTPVWQIRELSAQNSFQSQNDLRVHFGIKDALVIDSVQIRWPSGTVQYFSNLSPNLFYFVNETNGLTVNLSQFAEDLKNVLVSPNPARDEIKIQFNQFSGGTVSIYTLTGQLVYQTSVEGNSKTIDVSAFSKGTYVLVVENNFKRFGKKIVLEN